MIQCSNDRSIIQTFGFYIKQKKKKIKQPHNERKDLFLIRIFGEMQITFPEKNAAIESVAKCIMYKYELLPFKKKCVCTGY